LSAAGGEIDQALKPDTKSNPMKKTLPRSLWTATKKESVSTIPLNNPTESDVTVIGGGITGLVTAIHLRESGHTVTVLEAGEIGWGGSGRNGGHFNPGWKIDPQEIIARHGRQQGERIIAMADKTCDLVVELVDKYDLSSLKVLGSVGEPINEEAWHWYNDNIGKRNSPVIDTWWQTETGGIMISPIPYVTPTIPTFATLPFIGIQPAIMDENGNELCGNQVEGRLCIKFPWPSIARTIWGDHKRYKETYFSSYKDKYFTGDGALRDATGYYRITGRVDDVIIVSGHNLGTAPIEDAVDEHPAVAESAIVGFPHDIKGNALYGYVILKDVGSSRDPENLRKEINQIITEHIGPIAKLEKIQFTDGLPKTRSGKIMRRILRKIACGNTTNLGDTSTLLNPEVVEDIINNSL
jgi:acyl-CoA synthetase (AMP-forming)/AMP-acid ligase II